MCNSVVAYLKFFQYGEPWRLDCRKHSVHSVHIMQLDCLFFIFKFYKIFFNEPVIID